MLPTLLIACSLWITVIVSIGIFIFALKRIDFFLIVPAVIPLSFVVQFAWQFTRRYQQGVPMIEPVIGLPRKRKSGYPEKFTK